MNTYNNNYLTYVEPPVPKNAFLYKKTPTNISKIFNNNKKYLNDTSININQLKARASRYLLDKKYRGELDISSPGNKNILIDTDSELTANSKNTNNKNKGCTKLVIEKIESQKPQINKEYYKFTNQPKTIVHDLNENQDIFFTKKNYVTQNVSRCNSILRNTNKIINKNYSNSNFNNFSLQQGFDYNKYSTLNNYNDFGYNSPMKKTYTRSTNNIVLIIYLNRIINLNNNYPILNKQRNKIKIIQVLLLRKEILRLIMEIIMIYIRKNMIMKIIKKECLIQ